ncbi:hypothetical protein D9615_009376 [Tricholomella constricta]|uniref:Phosphoinositide phospholipase C n=1 Tax=Tricholomella constricta TaxID=117010 RepID=A0A8H5M007_9AGAR|nr:hypothetical protein D9615_009376 [Tricholomella constricta]
MQAMAETVGEGRALGSWQRQTAMQLPEPPSVLRRAGNLLTSTGQPASKELQSEAAGVEPPASLKRTLSASIRKTFKSVTQSGRHSRSRSTTSAALMDNVTVPQLLQQGTPMTKVSSKKRTSGVFRLDPDIGEIIWEGKKHRIIPIENIKELRSGSDARYYREQFQLAQEYEDRWLIIVYILDGAYKTLHLVAPSKDVFRMWDKTLRELHAIRQQLMSGLGNFEMRQAIWEKHYWKGEEKLGFDDVEKLCRRLYINSSSDDLLRLFKQADIRQRDYLDFEDFRRFVKLLKGRPEIDRLYKKLRARGGGVFDFPVFEKLMRDKQKSSLSTPELQAVFERYSEPPGIMTTDTFTAFLLSPDNSAFLDQHGRDMTRPLSDYYISSSHNTYLVGHQLVGNSTIEGYIRALLHSCRSVELDIFDGDNPSEPQIFHGKTLTSKVSLREVCRAILKYGFVTSPYPIIISAEVHCSLAGQDAIADIMKEVFGPALVQEPHQGVIERLPSPEELKGRILLKTKDLYLMSRNDSGSMEGEYDTSAASSSTSDSDAVFEQGLGKRVVRRRGSDSTTVKELKDDFLKAGSNVLQRVRSVGKSSSLPRAHTLQHQQQQQLPSQLAVKPRTAASLPVLASPVPFYGPQRVLSSSPAPLYTGPAYPQSPPPLTPGPISPLTSTSTTTTEHSTPASHPATPTAKPKMSFRLLALLVYTVGVKCRGINKKEVYAPEHMFSLSETVANRMLKSGGMQDLIKHCRTHLVRVYPKGTRIGSTNFEPHRYWSAGAQLVAINWQTFDLGYMINHAMFQRNGRAGYVLKPPALLASAPAPAVPPSATSVAGTAAAGASAPPSPSLAPSPAQAPPKDLLLKHTRHHFDVSIVSAQQLPRPRDANDKDKSKSFKAPVDPYVEVSLHVPDWPAPPSAPAFASAAGAGAGAGAATAARTVTYRTGVVKNNGFNPVWEEKLRVPFECVGDMRELVFVRFAVRAGEREDAEPLAVYCASLGSLGMGYRHLPLHDTQLSQYLFSTLFVCIAITDS